MDFGFNLHIDCCNVPIVIGFVCVMIMVVVMSVCGKNIILNRNKKVKKLERGGGNDERKNKK
jgi:hypothetical protein